MICFNIIKFIVYGKNTVYKTTEPRCCLGPVYILLLSWEPAIYNGVLRYSVIPRFFKWIAGACIEGSGRTSQTQGRSESSMFTRLH